jgi:hypothetical protein
MLRLDASLLGLMSLADAAIVGVGKKAQIMTRAEKEEFKR